QSKFFFHGGDGVRAFHVTAVQTCALPISSSRRTPSSSPPRPRSTPDVPTSGAGPSTSSAPSPTSRGTASTWRPTPSATTPPESRAEERRVGQEVSDQRSRNQEVGRLADTG